MVCFEKTGVLDLGLPVRGFFGFNLAMTLPMTGTAALLELLSPFIPDDELGGALPRHLGSGRHTDWSSAQLFRVLLLLLLTPARSANLLCQLLPEHRAWRRFAHLPNRCRLPSPRQLHEFRRRLTPGVMRRVNEHLLLRVMATWPKDQPGIALIDATDLPAATNEYKKSPAAAFPRTVPHSGGAPSSRASRVGSLATRSTPCGCGWDTTGKRFCSCRS
jgi:hypothetical protein